MEKFIVGRKEISPWIYIGTSLLLFITLLLLNAILGFNSHAFDYYDIYFICVLLILLPICQHFKFVRYILENKKIFAIYVILGIIGTLFMLMYANFMAR